VRQNGEGCREGGEGGRDEDGGRKEGEMRAEGESAGMEGEMDGWMDEQTVMGKGRGQVNGRKPGGTRREDIPA
jgi:hypothetical protein